MSSRGNVSLVARVRSQYMELPGEPRHSPLRMEALCKRLQGSLGNFVLDFCLELHVASFPSLSLPSITKDKKENKHASKQFGESTKQKPTRWS